MKLLMAMEPKARVYPIACACTIPFVAPAWQMIAPGVKSDMCISPPATACCFFRHSLAWARSRTLISSKWPHLIMRVLPRPAVRIGS